MKGLNSFILLLALISSVQTEQITQARPYLPDNFEDIDAESSHSQGAVIKWLMKRALIKVTAIHYPWRQELSGN